MLEVAKKPRIDQVSVQIGGERSRIFIVPKDKGESLVRLLSEYEVQASVPVEEVFPDLADPARRPGVMLKGARLKKELTQVQLAKKIGIPQSHISAMENGSRPIGKNMGRRFAKFFKTDYRLFL